MLAVSHPHWICPGSRRVCFPCLHCLGSRLLCQEMSEASSGLYALPRSMLLRFRYSGTPQRCRLGWACILCPSQVQAAQVTRSLASAVTATYRFPRPCCSVFWVYNWRAFSGVPCVSSGELISGCDCPGNVNRPQSQELLVSNGTCLQFGRRCLFGSAIVLFWLGNCYQ